MSDYASTSIPKPNNWQDFQNQSCVLFQCVLNDPNTTTYGRDGQGQQGVDVYGRRDEQADYVVGVQCKLKGGGKEVSDKELIEEIKKANRFKPKLREFILVTTAPDDAKIQATARQITEKHAKQNLFSVHVWGWQTLEREISKYPQALEAFHPDLTPFTARQIKLSEENVSLSVETRDDIKTLKAQLESVQAALTNLGTGANDQSSAAQESLEQNLHREIDGYRDLLTAGKPDVAKDLLEALKQKVWETASSRVKFRLTTNIGAANLHLGNDDLAADAFLEAVNYDAIDPVGMANLALAHLLRGNANEAIAAANAALAEHPDGAIAAAHLISAHLQISSIANPLSLAPESLRDTAEVQASAINFLCNREDPTWRELARAAAENHPEHQLINRRAAEAVLDLAISAQSFEIGGLLPAGLTTDDLKHAAQVLQEQWDEIRVQATWPNETALPQNLAKAYWSLDDHEAAFSVIEQALARCPESRELKQLKVPLLFEANQTDAALGLAWEFLDQPGIALMLAETLLDSDPTKAREILEGDTSAKVSESHRLASRLLLAKTYIHEGDHDQALKNLTQLVTEFDGSVEPLLELSRLQRLLGNDEADNSLTEAIGKLRNEAPFFERFRLADALETAGRHDEVVTLLEGIIDTSRDSPALRLLVFATINSDRRSTTHALLESLPENVLSKRPYQRANIALDINRKDFDSALTKLTNYLEVTPDDLEMRLQWLGVSLRSNKEDDVARFLKGDVEALDGPPKLCMDLAQYLDRFASPERAFKLGYRVFLNHSTDPEVHLKFVGLLLNPERSQDYPLEREVINDHVAFQIDDGRGGQSWFVIEPEPQLRKNEAYIAPDNVISQRAKGLKVGDQINWEDHDRAGTWTICALKHKYLYALHQTLEQFERHFPLQPGLRSVQIKHDAEEPLEELFGEVKGRHDSIERVLDAYTSSPMPIHILTDVLGGDIIETRHGFLEAGRKFRVCQGTAPERASAIKALQDNEKLGCIVDALTLNTILRLELQDCVQEVCGPIAVTGSTRDVFWARANALNAMTELPTSIFWKDGNYYRQESTQEEFDAAKAVRQSDLEWIDNHAEKVPAEGTEDAPAELRRLNYTVGANFIDDMLAAQGSNHLLLCQDQTYRALAEHSLNIRTSWLQPALMLATDNQIIDRQKYEKAIISLIDFGDEVIAIDSRILLAAAEDKENSRYFELVADQLGGPDAEVFSHVGVAAEFLNQIWSARPRLKKTAVQTGLILKSLLRNPDNWRDILALLRRIYIGRYGGAPLLDAYILQWCQGHFLIPFNEMSLPLANIS